MKFTFHVLGLPHAPTTLEHVSCAYTSKVYKFCKMMTNLGHTVIHYGVEGSNPKTLLEFNILSLNEYREYFRQVDYKNSYYPVKFDLNEPYFKLMNDRFNTIIQRNAKPTDFVCIIGGNANGPAVYRLSQPVVEYGIGYYGVLPNSYKCFESYAHMHTVYGTMSHDPDGRFCDAVVPNYFDLDQFTFNPNPQGYVLFMGRLINRKGINIAVESTKRAGVKLVVCGQGDKRKWPSHVEFVGYADVKRRNELMRNAKALICPTLYLEPFGGVAVEAQLCGTPVISTDFGAFTETVDDKITGFRCHTMKEFVDAIGYVHLLDRYHISSRARALYSLEAVGLQYEQYFTRLYSMLFEGGWNA